MTANPSLRSLLRTMPTTSRMATLVTLSGGTSDSAQVTIAYVPDRVVLTREGFASYAAACSTAQTTAEGFAATVAEDIANEVVPYWQRVTVTIMRDGVSHTVTVEDRQPGWEHPTLLSATNASVRG